MAPPVDDSLELVIRSATVSVMGGHYPGNAG
jgi:hypothetical protein